MLKAPRAGRAWWRFSADSSSRVGPHQRRRVDATLANGSGVINVIHGLHYETPRTPRDRATGPITIRPRSVHTSVTRLPRCLRMVNAWMPKLLHSLGSSAAREAGGRGGVGPRAGWRGGTDSGARFRAKLDGADRTTPGPGQRRPDDTGTGAEAVPQ
jgi:hypothetical protein